MTPETPTTTPTTPPAKGGVPRRRRAANVTLWILQVAAVLGFAGAALQKLTGDEQVMQTFDALGWGAPMRYLLAALELLGSVALLCPPLAGLAAIAFVALTIGAVAVQVAIGGSVVAAAILLVVSAAIAWGRRGRTVALWTALRRDSRAPRIDT